MNFLGVKAQKVHFKSFMTTLDQADGFLDYLLNILMG